MFELNSVNFNTEIKQSFSNFRAIMTTQGASNVYTSFEPLYYYLKFLGLFQSCFCEKNKKTKFRDNLWRLITISMIISFICVFVLLQEGYWDGSNFLMNAFNFCAIFGYSVEIFIVLYQWKHSEKIFKILTKLDEFDEMVRIILGVVWMFRNAKNRLFRPS